MDMDGVPDLPLLPGKVSVVSTSHKGVRAQAEWSHIQKQVDSCLDSGLSFVSGTWLLTSASKHQLREVACILAEHPKAGVAVMGYTAKPSGSWSTKARCEELGFRRAAAVRDALQEAGCKCRVVARGLGYVDEFGARCEVALCDDRDLAKLASDEVAAAAARGQLPPDILRIEFDRGASSIGGSSKVVEFKRLPLGMSFDRRMPSEVTVVEPGGQAEELGVKAGWVFRAVNGQSLEGKDWPTLLSLLEQGSAPLRRAG